MMGAAYLEGVTPSALDGTGVNCAAPFFGQGSGVCQVHVDIRTLDTVSTTPFFQPTGGNP